MMATSKAKTKDNLIHVRLDYEEAIEAKRDFLFSQIISLRIAKAIKGYSFYRMKELDLKASLYRRMKDLRLTLAKLQKVLPKLEIPQMLEDKLEHKTREKERSEPKKKNYDLDVESQLREIQHRLDELQRNSMGL